MSLLGYLRERLNFLFSLIMKATIRSKKILEKENTRAVLRYPYRSAVMYTALNYAVHAPNKTEVAAEVVDLSDSGM